MSAYYEPGTIKPPMKKTKTKQDRGGREKLKEENGQGEEAEGTEQPEVTWGYLP